jgi:hypothetical protein
MAAVAIVLAVFSIEASGAWEAALIVASIVFLVFHVVRGD